MASILERWKQNVPEAVKILLEHGANPNFATPDRGGLLHFVAQYTTKDIMKVLMEHANLEGLDVDLRSSEGKTAGGILCRTT